MLTQSTDVIKCTLQTALLHLDSRKCKMDIHLLFQSPPVRLSILFTTPILLMILVPFYWWLYSHLLMILLTTLLPFYSLFYSHAFYRWFYPHSTVKLPKSARSGSM